MNVTIANGKYTIVHKVGTTLHALRYGEPWRDLVGDGLILAMAQEIEDLRLHINQLEAEAAHRDAEQD